MLKIFALVFLFFIGSTFSENIKYQMVDDFDIEINIPKIVYFSYTHDGNIVITNKGNKSWEYVQVQITFPEDIFVLDVKNQSLGNKKNCLFKKIKPSQKKKIQLKIKSNSHEIDFICKVILIAETKPNYLSVAQSVTTHENMENLEYNYTFKYDTNDPIFIYDKTTYVLELKLERIKSLKYIFLTFNIDDKMKFLHATGPTQHQYVTEKKTVIFFPFNVKAKERGKVITYKITCKAMEEGNAITQMLIWTNELDIPIFLEEPTSIFK